MDALLMSERIVRPLYRYSIAITPVILSHGLFKQMSVMIMVSASSASPQNAGIDCDIYIGYLWPGASFYQYNLDGIIILGADFYTLCILSLLPIKIVPLYL